MQILTKEKWSLFKPDGKLFELLIEELLHAEYPDANFEHTSWTRDGGKDFEGGFSFFDSKIKTWAECKYHQDSLPIKDVSMTLFMAYVESAHTILFFSYSPVNAEFQKYIDLYQKKSDKIVKIFDDLALEELILKNKDKIRFTEYFKDFITEQTLKEKDVTYKYWVHSKTQSKSLHINELVRLEFCAMNHSSNEKVIHIKINHNRHSKYFEILNPSDNLLRNSVEIKLPPNGISGISIDLRLSEYSEKLKYPSIIVKNSSKENCLEIDSEIKCLWLAETPLLGEENNLFIKRIPDFINIESGNYGILIGSSGTGKSRIIDEITTVTTGLKYRKIAFDADVLCNLSAENFFKELISEIENIPELSHITAENIKKKYLTNSECNDYTNFALKILFNNKINYEEIRDELVDYLLYNLSIDNFFVVLDNIQFYDENILAVFQEIIERHNKLATSFILFSANTDYVYEDTICERIIKKIELMESKFPHQFFFKYMKCFSESEAFEYLQKCLNESGNTDKEIFNYELTLKKIIEMYGTNPLFLQNYLIYLYQESIIKQTDYSSYYIKDIDKLKKSFTNIPRKIHDLLKLREERFVEDKIPKGLYEKYILFVSYLAFARWMPFSMIQALVDIPLDIVHSMEKIGLIKQNDKNEYGFYHQQIEEYYKNKYPYDKLSNDALRKFSEIGLNHVNKRKYLECIFLAQYILNELDDTIWQEIVLKICTDNLDYQKTYAICIAASNILDNISLNTLPDRYIEIYSHMTNIVTDRNGISSAQELYRSVYNRFCCKPKTFILYLVDLVNITQSYIINELHMNHPQEGLNICQNVISLLNQNYSGHKEINILLLNIYETQIFIYNELQELDKALITSDILIDLAGKTNKLYKLISAWFLRGDIYYTNISSYDFKEEICECWNKAYEIYKNSELKADNDYSSVALYINVHMRVVLLKIIQKEYTDASEHMISLKKYIGKTKMPFFEIKLRHLYVCFMIFSQENKLELYSQYRELDFLLKESIDICTLYGSQTLYLDCFHLLAILQRMCGKGKNAIDNYQKCYEILQLLIIKQGNSSYWAHFILDMTIAMRQLNNKNKIPPHIWQLAYSSPDVETAIKTICNITEEKLNDYLENMTIGNPLYYDSEFVIFPKI